MKNTTKEGRLQKKLERLNFWRQCYILPLIGISSLTFVATIVSLLVSIATGNFLVTGALAIATFASSSTTIAGLKLNNKIDSKFYKKIIKIKLELDELNKLQQTEEKLVKKLKEMDNLSEDSKKFETQKQVKNSDLQLSQTRNQTQFNETIDSNFIL